MILRVFVKAYGSYGDVASSYQHPVVDKSNERLADSFYSILFCYVCFCSKLLEKLVTCTWMGCMGC